MKAKDTFEILGVCSWSLFLSATSRTVKVCKIFRRLAHLAVFPAADFVLIKAPVRTTCCLTSHRWQKLHLLVVRLCSSRRKLSSSLSDVERPSSDLLAPPIIRQSPPRVPLPMLLALLSGKMCKRAIADSSGPRSHLKCPPEWRMKVVGNLSGRRVEGWEDFHCKRLGLVHHKIPGVSEQWTHDWASTCLPVRIEKYLRLVQTSVHLPEVCFLLSYVVVWLWWCSWARMFEHIISMTCFACGYLTNWF